MEINYTYLTKPKLYNTGFLLNDKISRIKQGLLPQTMSNNCYVTSTGIINDTNLLKNPYYNNQFFPIRMPYVEYGTPIPDNSLCLRNIASP